MLVAGGPSCERCRQQSAGSLWPLGAVADIVRIVNGRHRGSAQHRVMTGLWAARTGTVAIVMVAVPTGVIAVLAWLIFGATPREQWAGSGLILLGMAIATIVRFRGRNWCRWSAASQALIAAALFMQAAVSQPDLRAYAAINDSVRAIGVACLCVAIALIFRSEWLGGWRPS